MDLEEPQIVKNLKNSKILLTLENGKLIQEMKSLRMEKQQLENENESLRKRLSKMLNNFSNVNTETSSNYTENINDILKEENRDQKL